MLKLSKLPSSKPVRLPLITILPSGYTFNVIDSWMLGRSEITMEPRATAVTPKRRVLIALEPCYAELSVLEPLDKLDSLEDLEGVTVEKSNIQATSLKPEVLPVKLETAMIKTKLKQGSGVTDPIENIPGPSFVIIESR